jgi:hypothetical protein
MRPEEKFGDPRLEEAVNAIRNQSVESAAVSESAERVWQKVAVAAQAETEWIRSCADFRELLPAYRSNELPEAKALLVKDHLHECVGCRKVFETEGRPVVAINAKRPGRWSQWSAMPAMRWAMAAAVMLTVGLSSYVLWNQMGSQGTGAARLHAANGMVFTVADGGMQPLAIGAEIGEGAEIRTAKDATAVVELRDGSLVELRERSGMAFRDTRKDTTVQLSRGSIIVQAAKRSAGHLFVDAPDCRVAVTGTIFSVNSGVKGSRVSVIEGQVQVAQAGRRSVLSPGQQVTTTEAVAPVSVQDEVAWSRNFDQYATLLQQANAVQQQLAQLRMPALRYSSTLAQRLPANTVVYAAVPNLGRTLGEAQALVEQKLQQSPELRQWWEANHGAKSENFKKAIEEIQAISTYLGEEVVIAALQDASGNMQPPVVIAEVTKGGFKPFLEAEIARLAGEDASKLKIATSLAELPAGMSKEPVMLVLDERLVIASPDAGAVRQIAAGTGGFLNSPLGQRVSASYQQGAGLLVAVDISQVTRSKTASSATDPAAQSVANLKFMVVEQRETQSGSDTHATFSFAGERTGIASWLSAPAPIGALDYVTPSATLVSAAVLKQPASMVDDLFRMASSSGKSNFQQEVQQAETKLGVRVREDLAASLGGEFVMALDGPALPSPSWKVVLEVYDAQRLRTSIDALVAAVNREATAHGKSGLTHTSEPGEGGLIFGRIVKDQGGLMPEIHYVIGNGYMVAAPNRGLLETAMKTKASGSGIARTAQFQQLLPRDGNTNFSAVVYSNLGATFGAVAEAIGQTKALSDAQRAQLEAASAQMKPFVVTAYGERDQITLASSGNLMAMGLGQMLGMPSPLALSQSFMSKPGTNVR